MNLLAALVTGYDTSGIYGGIFHYAMVFATVGSALLGLIYFWYKGQLCMDEEASIRMMLDDKERDNGPQ